MGTVTWDDVIEAIAQAMQELRALIDGDPQHGAYYQQRLAVMLLRWQEAQAAKRYEEEQSTERPA